MLKIVDVQSFGMAGFQGGHVNGHMSSNFEEYIHSLFPCNIKH